MNNNCDKILDIIKEAYTQYFVTNRSVWITELILSILYEKGIVLTENLYDELQNRVNL